MEVGVDEEGEWVVKGGKCKREKWRDFFKVKVGGLRMEMVMC